MKQFCNISDFRVEFNDLVFLAETWAETNVSIPECLRERNFKVIQIHATRESIFGRPSGGLMCLFNKNLFHIEEIKKSNNYMIICVDNLKLVIVFVYFNLNVDITKELKEIVLCLETDARDWRDYHLLYGGDFNARIGNLNSFTDTNMFKEYNISAKRESLDKIVNKRGKELTNYMG